MKAGHVYIIFLIFNSLYIIPEQISGQALLYLGTREEDKAYALKRYNNKYYIAGTTRKDYQSATDYYILQLDPDGLVEKRITYGFPKHDVGNQVWIDDQGIFIFGSAFDRGFLNVDMHLFKIGDQNLPEWENFYGTQYQDQGLNFIRTRDGGFALIGYSNSQVDGGDVYFVKTDAHGNVKWEKKYGPPYVDYGFSLTENTSGEFLLAGTENGFYNPTQTDFATHDADILLIKTDCFGNEIWYKTFGGDGHDWAKDIIDLRDGSYLVCGSTQSFGKGNFDVFLMKIDDNGNELWMKTFGGSEFDYGEKIVAGVDGNIYISATSASFSENGNPDHFIIKTNAEGETIWTKILGTEYSDYSSGLVATPDSGVVFTGWSTPGEIGKSDIVFYKLSKDGELHSTSNITTSDTLQISVYPNPAKQQFTIEINSPPDEQFSFFLFDTTGKNVLSKIIFSDIKTKIKSPKGGGMFFYKVEKNGDTIHTGKLIINN